MRRRKRAVDTPSGGRTKTPVSRAAKRSGSGTRRDAHREAQPSAGGSERPGRAAGRNAQRGAQPSGGGGNAPRVAILMGSDSDWSVMSAAADRLAALGVPHQAHVLSAHRSPEETARFARGARAAGYRVMICGAGAAAHLAGAVAAQTTLPVLGVPLEASALGGLDALLATVQMPAGVPVGTLAVGKAGADNAAILAAQILAVSDAQLAARLEALKSEMTRAVEEKDRRLQETRRGRDRAPSL